MLKDMITKFLGLDSMKTYLEKLDRKEMSLEGLTSYLSKELKEEGYFIVHVDLWNIHDWNWIKSIFCPMILITTNIVL
jgi:hypothetical protein